MHPDGGLCGRLREVKPTEGSCPAVRKRALPPPGTVQGIREEARAGRGPRSPGEDPGSDPASARGTTPPGRRRKCPGSPRRPSNRPSGLRVGSSRSVAALARLRDPADRPRLGASLQTELPCPRPGAQDQRFPGARRPGAPCTGLRDRRPRFREGRGRRGVFLDGAKRWPAAIPEDRRTERQGPRRGEPARRRSESRRAS